LKTGFCQRKFLKMLPSRDPTNFSNQVGTAISAESNQVPSAATAPTPHLVLQYTAIPPTTTHDLHYKLFNDAVKTTPENSNNCVSQIMALRCCHSTFLERSIRSFHTSLERSIPSLLPHSPGCHTSRRCCHTRPVEELSSSLAVEELRNCRVPFKGTVNSLTPAAISVSQQQQQ